MGRSRWSLRLRSRARHHEPADGAHRRPRGGRGPCDGPLRIVSDSTYVVNCFRDRWYDGWKRRGWVNSQRKPVANRDLWEPLIDLVPRAR